MVKKGDILTSLKGEKWNVIAVKGDRLDVERFYKGIRVGTVYGVDSRVFKKK